MNSRETSISREEIHSLHSSQTVNISIMDIQILLIVTFIVLARYFSVAKEGCASPQLLEIGKSGTISCSFPNDFSSVHWYYNLDVTDGPPTLSYEDQTVKGEGYDSGKFDIHPDGSLIINNVSVHYETNFTVVKFQTLIEPPERFVISIITIIHPTPSFPLIDGCDMQGSVCYIPMEQRRPILCKVQRARPGIPINWAARTLIGDTYINNTAFFSNQSDISTNTTSVVDPFIYPENLTLLVCKADDQLNMLDRNESIVVVHKKQRELILDETTQLSVNRSEKIQLPCTDNVYQLLVWEMFSAIGNASTTVVFDVVSLHETYLSAIQYELHDGNLVIANTKLHHEGLYRCIYTDGTLESVKSVNLTVHVAPIPIFPIVDGCSPEWYCVLEVKHSGQLTCTVKGIRPETDLEWRVFHPDSSNLITFHDQRLSSKLHGDTFDITLTAQFTVKKMANEKITVECRTTGPVQYFRLSSKVDLLFTEFSTENSFQANETDTGGIQWFKYMMKVVIVITTVALFSIGSFAIYLARRGRKRSSKSQEEDIPMIQIKEIGKPEDFISELKRKYENYYSAIKPIPFYDKFCNVNEFYVEGGIEYLPKRQTTNNRWESLDSYKSMFTHPDMKGTRWIIEGDPGFGKSTLSLQLMYEWCQQIEGSFMRKVDIFLLIRLRQLEGISCIYEAVKMFSLPKDSKLGVEDIKDFLENCTSALIILDGFDEYPDRQSNPESDVLNILRNNMMTKCRVVLTTRSSQLPKEYAPQTNRLQLTGFKNDAQEQYLQIVGTFNGCVSTENNTIKEWLEENPILGDICEVPLFFVMYAHLSFESDDLKQCTSVTSFFRYTITCLISHMKLKFNDENVKGFNIAVDSHQKLDKLCFNKLNGHSYNPDMNKKNLTKLVGESLINKYLKIGILIEEESIVLSNRPSIQSSKHVISVSKVRFYHSLFCEWFAAHHVADTLKKVSNIETRNTTEEELEILEDLDPSNLQYVFRFASGLNAKAAKHILDFLTCRRVGLETFSILCILEQRDDMDVIMENVREICSRPAGLQIRDQDTKILQRSIVQLLKIASSKELPIEKLVLSECFELVHPSLDTIVLKSQIRLPLLTDIKEFGLEQKGIKLSEEDLDLVLKYSLRCRNLKQIRFLFSMLPFEIKETSTLKQLGLKGVEGIKVLWYPTEIWYSLDLLTGSWQKQGGTIRMEKDEYENLVAIWKELNKTYV